MKIPVKFVVFFSIIFAGALAYLNSLLNPFIWDDIVLILTNSHIANLGYIPRLFMETIYHQDMTGRFYRPVLMSSFALDYKLWGMDALGYHFTSIFFHISAAILVYYLIWLIFGRRALAFLTAVFFLLHPVQTEAVTYVSGRADPLSVFFCLVSFIFFIKYLNRPDKLRRLFYAASILFFLFGILSKETSVILPFVFIFYESSFGKEKSGFKSVLKYLPFAGLLCVYAFARSMILANVKTSSLISDFIPLTSRLLSIPMVIFTYVKLLLFPAGMHMERTDCMYNAPVSIFQLKVLAPLALLIAAGLLMWFSRKRLKVVWFGLVWFLLTLIPVLNIVPLNAFVAEHWLYLPSIGFFLAISAGFIKLIDFRPTKLYTIAVLADILLLLGILTVRQNYIWRDPVAFYKYTLKFSSESPRLHTNLGAEYFARKLYKQAEKEYKESLRIAPLGKDSVYNYVNLGLLYDTLGRDDEAMGMYNKAIELSPGVSQPYNFIGDIYFRRGKYDDAINFYKKAAQVNPNNANYWYILANAYLKAKMLKEAAGAYETALGIYSYNVTALVNLGNIYSEEGDLKKSLERYRDALKLAPDEPDIHYNIANVCARMGAYEQAKYFWEKTLELDPHFDAAKKNLDDLKKSGSY